MFDHAVVRLLNNLELAEQARQALLANGFDADAVSLAVQADEAGPTESNFVIGNSPPESQTHTYDRNYAPPAGSGVHGSCVMTVAATDAASAERAAGILARFGARAPAA